MWVNLFEADDYSEEAQVKIVTSLTVADLVKNLKQGELLMTDWLTSRSYNAEFRVVIMGRQVGVNQEKKIIDLWENEKRTPGGLIIPS